MSAYSPASFQAAPVLSVPVLSVCVLSVMTFILPTVTRSAPAGTERPAAGAESYWVTSALTEELCGQGGHMASPVVHFEIRSADPDASRTFYGQLFGWTFPDGGIPGYSY